MCLLKWLYATEWLNLHMVHSDLTETPYIVRGKYLLIFLLPLGGKIWLTPSELAILGMKLTLSPQPRMGLNNHSFFHILFAIISENRFLSQTVYLFIKYFEQFTWHVIPTTHVQYSHMFIVNEHFFLLNKPINANYISLHHYWFLSI